MHRIGVFGCGVFADACFLATFLRVAQPVATEIARIEVA